MGRIAHGRNARGRGWTNGLHLPLGILSLLDDCEGGNPNGHAQGTEAALRRLGQPSTISVIAEEMQVSEREVPAIQMAALAEQGIIFTSTKKRGTPEVPMSGELFGLVEREGGE